jgi:putative spermidine/putrescine transport system substrate-binding protein
MKLRTSIGRLALVVTALVVVAACGGTSNSNSACNAKAAKSAADCGGLDALVTAAKAEGKLNVIALPPDWANYGAVISGFKAKYNIDVTSANPNGSSQQEVDAITQQAGTSSAPDVVDVGMKVALANTTLFASYKVATWGDILDGQKEATGLWVQDYGGFMGIGYDPSKVPAITSVQDLLKSEFKGKVALAGDPTQSNQALNGVIMASVANGGSVDDVTTSPPRTARTCRAGRYTSPQTPRSAVTTRRRSTKKLRTRPPRGSGRSTSTPTKARTSG